MGIDQIRAVLETAGIVDCHEDDVRYRLLHEDKIVILDAIKDHGKHALANVTKDDVELYSRDSKSVSGGDSGFLYDVFLSENPPPSIASLKYVGPLCIYIFIVERDFKEKGIITIDSYSPFEDRAKYLKRRRNHDHSSVMAGHSFCATMQARNTGRVLRMHGRIEKCSELELPAIIKESWQGVWTPITKSWRELGIPMDEMKGSTMASQIGYIPTDGGDYLRFLLLVKAIQSSKLPIRVREMLLLSASDFYGSGGRRFGEFMNDWRCCAGLYSD